MVCIQATFPHFRFLFVFQYTTMRYGGVIGSRRRPRHAATGRPHGIPSPSGAGTSEGVLQSLG